MIEKRFTKYIPNSYGYTYTTTIVDHETNKQTENIDDFIDMLNALYEENQSLKSALKELKEIGDYQADRIKELDKENMEYYHLINCRNCKYYNWDYDGEDEFEVCEKGKNERLMYHRFCNEWKRD